MTFPTTSVRDNFLGTGPLSSNWTGGELGGTDDLRRFNDAAEGQTDGAYGDAYWNVETYGPGSEVFLTGVTPPYDAGDRLSAFARIQQPGDATFDAYSLDLRAGSDGGDYQYYYMRHDDGTPTQLGAAHDVTFNGGDGMGLGVTGTGATVTLQAYRHDGSVWSANVTPQDDESGSRIVSAGYIGLREEYWAAQNAPRIGAFGGGTISAGETLQADSGSYGITGSGAVGVLAAAAAAGSYAVTGAPAVGAVRLAVDAGGYLKVGSAALPSLVMPGAAGAYGLTGSATTLIKSFLLAAEAGTYDLAGAATALKAAYRETAAAGTYALSGADAALFKSFLLAAESGAYALSGADATLKAAYKALAEAGAYQLTGIDADLLSAAPPLVRAALTDVVLVAAALADAALVAAALSDAPGDDA